MDGSVYNYLLTVTVGTLESQPHGQREIQSSAPPPVEPLEQDPF